MSYENIIIKFLLLIIPMYLLFLVYKSDLKEYKKKRNIRVMIPSALSFYSIVVLFVLRLLGFLNMMSRSTQIKIAIINMSIMAIVAIIDIKVPDKV